MSLIKNEINKENIPLISVVIPVYNPQKYLINCLDSVLNQSFNNFELIIVNDASTDDSIQIINQYSKKDNRIKVFNNTENKGAAYSRNIGLIAATGKYIIFLDADDYFESDFFDSMFHSIDLSGADVAVCAFFWRDERYGHDIPAPKNIEYLSSVLCSPFAPTDFDCKVFYDLPFAPFNKLIRRSLLIEKKINFQELPNSNDVFFGIMSIAEANSIVFIPKPFIHYRYNTGCQISTNRYKNPLCLCFALEKVRSSFIERGIWSRYRHLYFDIAVSSIFALSWSSLDPTSLLVYLRSEGCSNLGLNKLSFKDFSNFTFYAQYRFLFLTDHKKFRGVRNILKCAIKSLFRLELSVCVFLIIQSYYILVSRYKKFIA